jgi:hypothetical protein
MDNPEVHSISESQDIGCGLKVSYDTRNQTVWANAWYDGGYSVGESQWPLRDFLLGLGITIEDCLQALSMQMIKITMPDGAVWLMADSPFYLAYANAKARYSLNEGSERYETVWQRKLKEARSDLPMLLDWAQKALPWSDILQWAKCLGPEPPTTDYHIAWACLEAKLEVINES